MHAQLVVRLLNVGRAAVGVAVKPPDESFRRLETAGPSSVPLVHPCAYCTRA